MIAGLTVDKETFNTIKSIVSHNENCLTRTFNEIVVELNALQGVYVLTLTPAGINERDHFIISAVVTQKGLPKFFGIYEVFDTLSGFHRSRRSSPGSLAKLLNVRVQLTDVFSTHDKKEKLPVLLLEVPIGSSELEEEVSSLLLRAIRTYVKEQA